MNAQAAHVPPMPDAARGRASSAAEAAGGEAAPRAVIDANQQDAQAHYSLGLTLGGRGDVAGAGAAPWVLVALRASPPLDRLAVSQQG